MNQVPGNPSEQPFGREFGPCLALADARQRNDERRALGRPRCNPRVPRAWLCGRYASRCRQIGDAAAKCESFLSSAPAPPELLCLACAAFFTFTPCWPRHFKYGPKPLPAEPLDRLVPVERTVVGVVADVFGDPLPPQSARPTTAIPANNKMSILCMCTGDHTVVASGKLLRSPPLMSWRAWNRALRFDGGLRLHRAAVIARPAGDMRS